MYFAELDGGAMLFFASLLAEPSAAMAMALTVSVTATVTGPAYIGELVVGVAPLVV
jgi:hypothetical protein